MKRKLIYSAGAAGDRQPHPHGAARRRPRLARLPPRSRRLTPPQPAEEQPTSGLGDLPRNETLIADILTGRAGSPSNFNEWVGWKKRDRGMQNLANEPLWSVDFATGEIINGLAAGDPIYNEDFTQRSRSRCARASPGMTASPSPLPMSSLRSRPCMAHEGFNAHTFFVDNVSLRVRAWMITRSSSS